MDDETAFLRRMIYYTAQDLSNAGERALKPYDVTLEQMYLMKHLYDTDGITQKDIGNIVSKTPANTTRILDRLEAKGMVERQSCPEDRRAARVYITSKGKELCEKVGTLLESFTLATFKGITEEELKVTRIFFNKVRENLTTLNSKSRKR